MHPAGLLRFAATMNILSGGVESGLRDAHTFPPENYPMEGWSKARVQVNPLETSWQLTTKSSYSVSSHSQGFWTNKVQKEVKERGGGGR